MSQYLGVPYSTVWKVLRKWVHCFSYKISQTTIYSFWPLTGRSGWPFALSLLARFEVDASWPWQILWSDKNHFHFSSTYNCRIWDTENRLASKRFHSNQNVSVWCKFTATLILGPFFFEEATRNGHVTCIMTANRFKRMLETFVLAHLQQRQFLDERWSACTHWALCTAVSAVTFP